MRKNYLIIIVYLLIVSITFTFVVVLSELNLLNLLDGEDSYSRDMPHPLYLLFFAELVIGIVIFVIRLIQYKRFIAK